MMSTNPANPLRNLRVVMPGFEQTAGRQPFHPWFLKSLERYSVSGFCVQEAPKLNQNKSWN